MDPGAVYTLASGEHQYGPFTVEQLRNQYNQGAIQPTDLVWCPGNTAWIPVSEVLGPRVATEAPPPVESDAPSAPPSPPASLSRNEEVRYPKPPSLNWVFLFLLTMFTFGVFGLVWMFVHATWVRRIDPTCNALFVLAVGIPLQVVAGFEGHALLASLVGGVATTWAYLWMRGILEERFGVAHSALMTFFFNMLYLQYHLTDIADGVHAGRRAYGTVQ